MWDVPALQHFFDDERLRRGWSMRDIAKRSKISLSKAYAIVKGDDNVEFETFESIALAFDLTPAELAVVIGKGSPEHDPAEVHLIALYRQVPEDKRPSAELMLRGLAVQPTRPATNRRQAVEANRQRAALRKLERHNDPGEDHGASNPLTPWFRRASDLVQGLTAQLAPALAR